MITQERLKEVLEYCPETGDFTWIKAKKGMQGNVAGTLESSGYIRIRLDYKGYRAHRLAFLYMTGSFPVDQVDHHDHVKHNNRWLNLKEATNQENQKNHPMDKRNTSGFTGVGWIRANKKWQAKAMVDGKLKNLGFFLDKSDAIAARKAANIKYGFHQNHGL